MGVLKYSRVKRTQLQQKTDQKKKSADYENVYVALGSCEFILINTFQV